ncbi:MAG: hypothetical protein AAGM67_16050, partial [Bacteroidota bacterium]
AEVLRGEDAAIVVVGDRSVVEEQLALFGEVTVEVLATHVTNYFLIIWSPVSDLSPITRQSRRSTCASPSQKRIYNINGESDDQFRLTRHLSFLF